MNQTNSKSSSSKDSIRVNQNKGDEKISKMTTLIFDPKNLKLYHIILIVVLMVYIWFSDFINGSLLMKSLALVTLISILIIESILIFAYIE